MWQRIDITSDVDKNELEQAKKDASSSKAPILKSLPFTESKYQWVLLYNHARRGQIDPSVLRQMKRSDLEYLGGMDFPHPDLTEPQRPKERLEEAEARHAEVTKLLGNVSRAKTELNRRNLWNTTAITAVAVLLSAVLGAFLATH
jgi:hypothetical protein